MAASFTCVGNWSTRVNHRPVPSHWYMLYRAHLKCAGFELTTLNAICTDCIGSHKSIYHTITTTTAPPSPSPLHVAFKMSYNVHWSYNKTLFEESAFNSIIWFTELNIYNEQIVLKSMIFVFLNKLKISWPLTFKVTVAHLKTLSLSHIYIRN